MQVVVKKALPKESPKKSDVSPLKSKNIIVSPNLLIKPVKSMKLSNDTSFPVDFNKVVLGSQKRSELRILWDALPPTICDLGKVHFTKSNRRIQEGSVPFFNILIIISLSNAFRKLEATGILHAPLQFVH